MIVRKDDVLERDGKLYRVICCDEEVFVLAAMEREDDHLIVDYERLEAYSNDPTINTLADLKFIERTKEE